MSADQLVVVVQNSFGVFVWLLLPLVVAAVAGSVLAGWLGQATGLQDQTVTAVARALSVVLAVGLLWGTLGAEVTEYTSGLWADLPDVGRAGAEAAP